MTAEIARLRHHLNPCSGRPPSYARYVGRVGALAVALGVGMAVATGGGLGIARADETDPTPADVSPTDTAPDPEATPPSTEPAPPIAGGSGATNQHKPRAWVPRMKLTVTGGARILRERKDRMRNDPDAIDTEKPQDVAENVQPTPAVDVADVAHTAKDDSSPRRARPDLMTRRLADRQLRAASPVVAQAQVDQGRPSAPGRPTQRLKAASPTADFAPPQAQQSVTTTAPQVNSLAGAPPVPAADTRDAMALVPGNRMNVASHVVAVALASFLTPGPTAPADPPVLLGILAWARREIQRTFFNRTPRPEADLVTTSEDESVTFDPLANDNDPDASDIKTVASYTQPDHGDLVLNDDGTFTYTPDPDYDETDQFTYTVTDQTSPWHLHGWAGLLFGGGHTSAPVTVTIAIEPVDDPPTVPGTATVETDEDTTKTGNLLDGATDTDSDDLDVSLSGDGKGTYGTLTVDPETGAFTYTPLPTTNNLKAGVKVTDTFAYTITDGANTAASTLTVNITGVNDAPTADTITVETDEDTTKAGNLLDGATDTDSDDLDVSLSGDGKGTYGTLTVDHETGAFTYTPLPTTNNLKAGVKVTDTFAYTITDGADTVASTLTVNITGVNDAPVAISPTLGLAGPETTEFRLNLLAGFSDPDGDDLDVIFSGTPNNGTVSVDPETGAFSYIPRNLSAGDDVADVFTYAVTDGTATTATYTLTIRVTGINDAPTAQPDSYIADEDTPLTVGTADGVLANDGDPDSPSMSVVPTSSPTKGNLALNGDGSFTYTPLPDANGTDSFTYYASDGLAKSADTTVTITIRPANDAPVVAPSITLSVDAQSGLGTGDLNATDADNDMLAYSGDFVGDHGELAVTPGGHMTYTPTEDARIDALVLGSRSDEFVVTVADGNGGTDQATVTVDVAPYVGPQTPQLLQFRDLFATQSAAIDDLDTQIRAVTVEIAQLQQQVPRDDALIQQKLLEQQNLVQERNDATEAFANTVFRYGQLKDQIVNNV